MKPNGARTWLHLARHGDGLNRVILVAAAALF
jgi:hypothetical protein